MSSNNAMNTNAFNPSFLTKKKASCASIDEEETSFDNKLHLSHLFDLPPVLFHIIFGDYLSVQEVSCFDKALCNHVDRARYFSLLNGMIISHRYIKTSVELAWIHTRQLRLESVDLGPDVNTEDLCALYPLHWSSIKKWDINNGPSVDPGSVVECLLKCTSLEVLIFSFNDDEAEQHEDYVDTLLSIFDDSEFCAHLRKISLANSFTSIDKTVAAISKHCHNLVRVDFDYDRYVSSEVMMDLLSTCGATLQEFDFHNCEGYSDNDYTRIIKYCPQLTSISSNITSGVLMSEISRCYPDLLSLNLYSFENNDGSESQSNGLIAIFEECRKLLSLHMCKVTFLSEAALIRAFECCRDLKSASFSTIPMTARVLLSLSTNCPQLEELSIHDISATKENLLQFSVQCNFPNLRTLRCANIDIDDRFILEFTRKSPLLRTLEITYSLYVTDVGIYHIATHCRNLTRILLINLPRVSSPEYLISVLINNPKIRESEFIFMKDSWARSTLDSLTFVSNPDENENGGGVVEEFTAELQELLDSRA